MADTSEDMVTLLDVCDVVAHRLWDPKRLPTSGYRAMRELHLRAVIEAHDMGHVLTGGDATRRPWGAFEAALTYRILGDPPAIEDVVERATALLSRMRVQS